MLFEFSEITNSYILPCFSVFQSLQLDLFVISMKVILQLISCPLPLMILCFFDDYIISIFCLISVSTFREN